MNLIQLQREVYKWSRHNFPHNEPGDPLHGATEELGELAHAFLKHKQGIRSYDNTFYYTQAAEDAIGDLIIYLADFCGRNGLDLERAVKVTWDQVKLRDWIANPEGPKDV